MLTYETLMGILGKEKTSNKLIDLPADFFTQAKAYLDKKEKLKTKADHWELDSAKRILQDLVELRERKIINHALFFVRSGAKPENMAEEELQFFSRLVEVIQGWQDKKKDLLEAKQEPKGIVAMLEAVDKFVGMDMKAYGPFKAGDISTLPKENAELLIKKGLAKEMALKH
ncbi:MAG: hypothetical protein ACE5FW_03240 [Candidatus Aenigmatarchaeota archaeon]